VCRERLNYQMMIVNRSDVATTTTPQCQSVYILHILLQVLLQYYTHEKENDYSIDFSFNWSFFFYIAPVLLFSSDSLLSTLCSVVNLVTIKKPISHHLLLSKNRCLFTWRKREICTDNNKNVNSKQFVFNKINILEWRWSC
jgi:hypothetical protein